MKISFTGHKQLYKRVFESNDGAIVLHDLAKRYHLLSSHNPKLTDAEVRFREGERNVILYILAQCNYDIEKYLEERNKYKLEIEHDR